jgi:hypothetical protein
MSSASPAAAPPDLREILTTLQAVRRGDFSRRVTEIPADPVAADIAKTLNELSVFLGQLTTTMSQHLFEFGTQGKLGRKTGPLPPTGAWSDLVDRLNGMSTHMNDQIWAIGNAIGKLREGKYELMGVYAEGDMLDVKNHVNLHVLEMQRAQQPA